MDLNIDAYIPESYIKNEYQKLDIYKRIAAIENEEEMDDMMEELIDRSEIFRKRYSSCSISLRSRDWRTRLM